MLDISELTGDLLTVGMFVALDYVWDKAKENRSKWVISMTSASDRWSRDWTR